MSMKGGKNFFRKYPETRTERIYQLLKYVLTINIRIFDIELPYDMLTISMPQFEPIIVCLK